MIKHRAMQSLLLHTLEVRENGVADLTPKMPVRCRRIKSLSTENLVREVPCIERWIALQTPDIGWRQTEAKTDAQFAEKPVNRAFIKRMINLVAHVQ